ncbi:hypothetical protein HJC23_006718 [Cyclotella cryptica]|uniref:Uncharacterized protein n=1 Tax=Cyclotella cryptica TaxID=29204 RepID=A0ABD3P2S7_9STRA
MKISGIIVLATIVGTDPVSAFVPSPAQSSTSNNASRLTTSAVDAAISIDPTYVIASVGAAVSAIGGAAIAFGKKGDEKNDSSVNVVKAIAEPEPIDVSIPYDAAASLAYDSYAKSSSKKVDFKQFQSLYYEQMVAEVKAKVQERKINEMKLVFEAMENEASGIQKQIDALFSAPESVVESPVSAAAAEASPTSVAAAKGVDLSVDYNSAAKLAYASSDKSLDFEAFRKVYEADTVAMVAAKNPYRK